MQAYRFSYENIYVVFIIHCFHNKKDSVILGIICVCGVCQIQIELIKLHSTKIT